MLSLEGRLCGFEALAEAAGAVALLGRTVSHIQHMIYDDMI